MPHVQHLNFLAEESEREAKMIREATQQSVRGISRPAHSSFNSTPVPTTHSSSNIVNRNITAHVTHNEVRRSILSSHTSSGEKFGLGLETSDGRPHRVTAVQVRDIMHTAQVVAIESRCKTHCQDMSAKKYKQRLPF